MTFNAYIVLDINYKNKWKLINFGLPSEARNVYNNNIIILIYFVLLYTILYKIVVYYFVSRFLNKFKKNIYIKVFQNNNNTFSKRIVYVI